MFGIGGFEFFLILIFGFLIVGPDRLPAMAKTLGKAINKFRGAQEEMNKVIKTEVYDPESKDPFKNPLEVLEKAGNSAKGSTEAKPAGSAASSPKPSSTAASGDHRESFSERKARYEKERAAKKAADAEKEAAEKRAANAAKDAAPAKGSSSAAKPASSDGAAKAKPAAANDSATPATDEKGE